MRKYVEGRIAGEDLDISFKQVTPPLMSSESLSGSGTTAGVVNVKTLELEA